MEWISVKDRVPDCDEMVLGFREGFITTARGWSLVSCGHFTHWMPLPEPPKEDA